MPAPKPGAPDDAPSDDDVSDVAEVAQTAKRSRDAVLATQHRRDGDPPLDQALRDAVRWIGGRRRLFLARAEEPHSTWIAWVLEGSGGVVLSASIYLPSDDLEAGVAEQLREALDAHRDIALAPVGGLLADDDALVHAVRSVVGTDPLPPTRAAEGSLESAWIDFRVALGLDARDPLWWAQVGDAHVQRFLRGAARLFAAAPWDCAERSFFVLRVPGHPTALHIVRSPLLDASVREIVFMISKDEDDDAARDVLVVAFAEEEFAPELRADVRTLMSPYWTEPRWYPHLQQHQGARVDAMLDHDAYDLAAALCEALAAVVGDIGMDRRGRIERTILLVEQPGVHVDVMAAWADVDG